MSKDKYTWIIGGDLPPIDNHSLVKLEILERYLKVYLNVLTQYPFMDSLKLTIVDGFSGGGVYLDENKAEIEGSPLRILNSINQAKVEINKNREIQNLKLINFYIDIIFIEKNKYTFDFLKKTLADRYLDSKDVLVLHNEFQLELNNVINDIKKRSRVGRAIFILDQYGYRDATIVEINRIFKNLEKAEVILTFSVDSLIDYLTKGSIPMLKEMGFTDEDVEYLFDTKEDDDKNREVLQYRFHQIIIERVGAKFYTPFFIKSDKCHRAYWLFHFSSHSRARDEMVKLHWDVENTFRHYGKPGLNMLIGYDSDRENSLFDAFNFDSFSKEKSLNLLKEEIPRIIYSKEEVTFIDLKDSILNTTPATVEMIKESLREAIYHNDIIVLSKNGEKRKKFSTIKDDDIIRAKKFKQQRLFL